MAKTKIKNTKTELKAQMDALRRYQRFLPMLQLKKQQLQLEIASITASIEALDGKFASWRASLEPWIALFSEEDLPADLVVFKDVQLDSGNIAGVTIPVFRNVEVKFAELDLLKTPSWYDDAASALYEAMTFAARRQTLEEQRRLITAELRTTSQRVNLFEKVKIPECQENMRIIRIHLGDESAASVVRGKIAKRRSSRGCDNVEGDGE